MVSISNRAHEVEGVALSRDASKINGRAGERSYAVRADDPVLCVRIA